MYCLSGFSSSSCCPSHGLFSSYNISSSKKFFLAGLIIFVYFNISFFLIISRFCEFFKELLALFRKLVYNNYCLKGFCVKVPCRWHWIRATPNFNLGGNFFETSIDSSGCSQPGICSVRRLCRLFQQRRRHFRFGFHFPVWFHQHQRLHHRTGGHPLQQGPERAGSVGWHYHV